MPVTAAPATVTVTAPTVTVAAAPVGTVAVVRAQLLHLVRPQHQHSGVHNGTRARMASAASAPTRRTLPDIGKSQSTRIPRWKHATHELGQVPLRRRHLGIEHTDRLRGTAIALRAAAAAPPRPTPPAPARAPTRALAPAP
eukprot:COSAG01_NODE_28981_length_648_cov_0.834244_1_plen_140_part_10